MILPASYLNGFAPRDGEPLYPELHGGSILAAAPCLGPSGSVLRDWSGFKRNGTASASLSSVPTRGVYYLNLNGSGDRINCGNPDAFNPAAGGTLSISAWVYRHTNTATYETLVSKRDSSGTGLSSYHLVFSNSNSSGTDKLFTLYCGGVVSYSTVAVPLAVPTHVCCVSNSSGSAYFVDGKPAGTTAATISQQSPIADLGIGAHALNGSEPFSGRIGEVRMYCKYLSAWQIKLLATRPGIAHEMAPRRRLSVQSVVSYSTFRPSVLRGSR